MFEKEFISVIKLYYSSVLITIFIAGLVMPSEKCRVEETKKCLAGNAKKCISMKNLFTRYFLYL